MKPKAVLWLRREVLPFLVLAGVLFSLRSSLADWNDVPTGSMQPTILVGDRIFVNKLAYDLKVPFTTVHLVEWGNPERGEIAVFYSPYDGTRLVKRVIGLPGDTVELRGNRLYLNGAEVGYEPLGDPLALKSSDPVLLKEKLPGWPHAVALLPGVRSKSNFGPYIVPEDHYFMMGDNRDDSFDSRYFGPVHRKQIVGEANRVVFSLNKENKYSPRGDRWGKSLKR